MISFPDFITKWTGRGIDYDGVFGDQCVDLMNQYCLEVLGITNPIQTLPGGTAYQIYQNAISTSQFDKIPNGPTKVPTTGDIIFWDTRLGPAGHVGIFISGDVYNIVSFDQNFPTGSLCHKQYHSYYGCAGWLHPKPQVSPEDQKVAQIKTIVDSSTTSTDKLAQIKQIVNS